MPPLLLKPQAIVPATTGAALADLACRAHLPDLLPVSPICIDIYD
jgi:hypothetical protein